MKHRQAISAAVGLTWLTGIGCASTTEGSSSDWFAERPSRLVECAPELMPNYLFHLTALAGVLHSASYESNYVASVERSDLNELRASLPLINWGYDYTGDLAPFFVFLPAYLELEDDFELQEYFDLFELSVRRSNYAPLRNRFANAHDRLDLWLFDYEGFFYGRADLFREFLPRIQRMSDIFERNFASYAQEIWPQLESELELIADEVNGQLWSLDLIQQWEALSGVHFQAPSFDVVITAAPSGPRPHRLGYARSLITAERNIERMVHLLNHEVGAHLLYELYDRQLRADAEAGSLDWENWAAYEGLVQFYGRQIMPGFEMDVDNEVERFHGYYQQIFDAAPRADAAWMLQRALRIHRDGD
ncbi:MAG: hypothetical protein VX733_06690 [Candidatus Latescibacterota bacterium]|nr:hypothetical protein [Candidatus Latescibacterota bacterium]